jgi:hypothetical protein
MKRTYVNTVIVNELGEVIRALVPQEKITTHEWKRADWTPQLEQHKKDRIKWLEKSIKKVDEFLAKDDIDEYSRIMALFFKDQLKVDLREDKQRLKYKGAIPKHIDERCVKQAGKSFSKYRRWGDKFYEQLKEDVDVHLWGNVVVDEFQSTGGGKYTGDEI